MTTTPAADAFARRYTDDEKEAAVYAYLDRRIRPLKAVVDLASRGELVTRDGRKVRPYDINPNTLKQLVAATKRRRQGKVRGAAFDNPEGTIDALRKRLIALADQELAYCERQRAGKRDPEHMRQIARAIREAAAIPVKGIGRAPGAKDQGERESGVSAGGLAGSLLAAHRRKPAPGPTSQTQTQAENTNATQHQRSNASPDQDTNGTGSAHRSFATPSTAAPEPTHTHA